MNHFQSDETLSRMAGDADLLRLIQVKYFDTGEIFDTCEIFITEHKINEICSFHDHFCHRVQQMMLPGQS